MSLAIVQLALAVAESRVTSVTGLTFVELRKKCTGRGQKIGRHL